MDKPLEANITFQLAEIQAELKVPKNQLNKFGGYKYRSAEDILEAVKPILHKNKVALTIDDEVLNIGDRYYIKATAYLTNGTGQTAQATAYAREAETKKGMDEAQITGSASSYARKYALNGLFAIDDTKDPDTQDNTHYEQVINSAPNYKDLPATAKQKQAIFTLLNKLDIAKSEQKKYLEENFNVTGEITLQLASDIISALQIELEPKND